MLQPGAWDLVSGVAAQGPEDTQKSKMLPPPGVDVDSGNEMGNLFCLWGVASPGKPTAVPQAEGTHHRAARVFGHPPRSHSGGHGITLLLVFPALLPLFFSPSPL